MKHRAMACWLAGLVAAPAIATGQRAVVAPVAPPVRDAPSVSIAAGPAFGAGTAHRWFLGSDYRDLWTTPIRVPELDLATFAGGLHATKAGGGMQTKSLRLETAGGLEYVFREVRKAHSFTIPAPYKGSFVEWLSDDQRAAVHPAGAIVASSLLQEAGVLHPVPILVAMPKDADLGEFGAEFSGKLGLLEEFPHVPKKGPGFRGAAKIIDSDELLQLLNRDPAERIDAPALLTARLMDLLLGDWDRHPGQWKWARMPVDSGANGPWLPIARDRDMAFVTYEGLIGTVGGFFSPASARYDAGISIAGLTGNAITMDRRLLAGLSRATWDSVTARVTGRMTDAVIDAAVASLPTEMKFSDARLAATLKARRDALAGASRRFYALVFEVVDLHATDGDDIASVTRVDDRFVDVRLSSARTGEYFSRRYDRMETGEIRIYLHRGDDRAVVTGHVARSIPVRLIGGDGVNTFTDSSSVGGRRDFTHTYDARRTDSVTYGDDTLFNRRPLERVRGVFQPPARDYGTAIVPLVDYTDVPGLGSMPLLGLARYRYGFGREPYESRIEATAEFAFHTHGWRVNADWDQRLERTPLHFIADARMSQLEVVSYRGLGNATVDSGTASGYFDARQVQWKFRPAVALALNGVSDLSLGPIVQYTTTSDAPGHLIAAARPYGAGAFGEAGLQLALHHDVRYGADDSPSRVVYDVTASVYPALWDVTSPFGRLGATAGASIPFSLPTAPLLVVRAGGVKLWGTFPYSESAFIGGEHTTLDMESQRYAGDAALFATSELRLRLATFTFLPIEAGILGLAEAGRVYVGGDSPGGWHTAVGGGSWVGLKGYSRVLTLTMVNDGGRASLYLRGGLGF